MDSEFVKVWVSNKIRRNKEEEEEEGNYISSQYYNSILINYLITSTNKIKAKLKYPYYRKTTLILEGLKFFK